MTEASGFPVLRSKKQVLPPGWEERISNKHPDKPFFYNTETKETRWTNPVEPSLPKNNTREKKKGSKRKVESNDEAESDASTSTLDKSTTSQRQKLKARRQSKNVIGNETSVSSVDTPMMRQMREKKAQRELEAQKKQKTKTQTPKITSPNQNQKLNDSLQETPSKRRTRRSSIASVSESGDSEKSVISNTSSLGSKIKVAATITEETEETNVSRNSLKKLPKIPKVQIVPVSAPFVVSSPQNYHQKNIANKRLQRIRQSLNLTKAPLKEVPTRKSIGGTPANDRLDKFRKRLSSEQSSPEKQSKPNEKSSPTIKSKLKLNSPLPNYSKEASSRIHSLENRVKKSGFLEVIKNTEVQKDPDDNPSKTRILEKIDSTDSYCEEMEWEPIEDEKIMTEVISVRTELFRNPTEVPNNFPCKTLQSATEGNSALYIVIDTNVFLSNLIFVEEVRDSYSEIFGRPFIVVPWTVLKELDYMKEDKNNLRAEALKQKARKAVEFLNIHFKKKHPRFLGQTPIEVERNKSKFETECPDDEILQTCLQIKDASKSPVLLSYDKNLCNKAMFFDVPVIGRGDPLEKIYYLKAAETTDYLSNSLKSNINENPTEIPISKKELLLAEDLMEKGKKIFKNFLAEVVAKEMMNIFHKEWELRVIIKPPWTTLEEVLTCANKHWMAAVSEGFDRRTEKILLKMKNFLREIKNETVKMENVKFFLELSNDIVQNLLESRHSELKLKTLSELHALGQCCLETYQALGNARLQESIGIPKDNSEEEMRSLLAFTVLENIYSFARDCCGIAATAVGLPCSFTFNKDHPGMTVKYALQNYKEISDSLIKLIDALKMVINKVDEDLYANDRTILALHEVLVNFSSDLNFEELMKMAPLDLLCCVKIKKPELVKGYDQLQELRVHYCQLANFQCK